MSAPPARAKTVGNASTRPIDTTACVLTASPARAAKPTLMNACRRPVFTGGAHFSLSLRVEAAEVRRGGGGGEEEEEAQAQIMQSWPRNCF